MLQLMRVVPGMLVLLTFNLLHVHCDKSKGKKFGLHAIRNEHKVK